MNAACVLGVAAAGLVALAFARPSMGDGRRYYAHPSVEDRFGVIAPWYGGSNGQVDWRVHVAADTLKRYPWTEHPQPAPHYVFNGHWRIAPDGTITIPELGDWDNGDLGQRAAYVLVSLVDYYRYSGDPASLGHIAIMADALLKYECTSSKHLWPGFLVSVPNRGKAYGHADEHGLIQLDIAAEAGIGLLKAYELLGEKRWFDAAKRWADALVGHCRTHEVLSPWPRYANAEDAAWEDLQTGGVVFILEFLDEVMRCGYRGRNGAVLHAREAGVAYLRDVLLPRWTVDDTWGRNYWDWPDPVQAENVTEFVARYLMAHPREFPNWRRDVRNILTLFLNRTSVAPGSGGGVFSGAWAYPESSGCCGRSLWYGPLELAPVYAEYGARTGDAWAKEMARRQLILATYDANSDGVVEDNIDGGVIVAGDWFKIAHPMALKHCLNALAWLPDTLGPTGENHIMRASSVVRNVHYGCGRLEYDIFDAPPGSSEVLRLAYVPTRIVADGDELPRTERNAGTGWSVRRLTGGDCLVTVRHDGKRHIVVLGPDPQQQVPAGRKLAYSFEGNQVRVLGSVGPSGGLAQLILDGKPLRTLVDCWCPQHRSGQVLAWINGLANGRHTLEVRPLEKKNPLSRGVLVQLEAFQSFGRVVARNWGAGGGPRGAQRVIFGYSQRVDYRDHQGNSWRPATEWVSRIGHLADIVRSAWFTAPTRDVVFNTRDAEIYRYGAHAKDLTFYFTVGPGSYTLRLHFMEDRRRDAAQRLMTIRVNGRVAAEHLDIAAAAGGYYRAFVWCLPSVEPRNGVVEVQVAGEGEAEAVLRAAELLPLGR
ncbi:MAG: malectin domain-containing carbohydrate-binding protein [Chthonomonadales bacterium]